MTIAQALRATVLLAVLCVASSTALADGRHFVLNASSSITVVCLGCTERPAAAETLSGSFDVTLLPVEQPYGVAAITNVHLSSLSYTITGNGFLQRVGLQRQALVLDAQVN